LHEYQKINSIIVFIGPEGGFVPKEVETAKDAGCKLVGLGRQSLRAETAAIAISALFLMSL